MRFTAALLFATLAFVPQAWSNALVRVAHLSPDTPNVNILVNDETVLSDIPFTAVSDYLSLPAGTYNIKVAATADTSIVPIDVDVTVDSGIAYTIAATDVLANVTARVYQDDIEGSPTEAKVRFLHTSPDAPAVDVTDTAGNIVFGNFSFGQASDYTSLPPGDYDLEVRLAGTSTTVLSLGTVTLEAATNYNVFAIGLVGDMTLDALISLSAEPKNARVRVGHLSPDAPNVDVLVDGAVAIQNLAFTSFTPYIDFAPGTYQIEVVPAGQAGPVVIDELVTVFSDTDYTVAATDFLASITAQVYVDDREVSSTDSEIRFVHLSPDAPAVDIALVGGAVLFPNFSFGQASAYLPVAPGTYNLEVRQAGQTGAVLTLPPITVEAGQNFTAFAAESLANLTALLEVDIDDRFIRGDVDRDDAVQFVDAIKVIRFVTGIGTDPICSDAADVNDNGHVDIGDGINLLNYLFLAGSAPSSPFPSKGTDASDDRLGCTIQQ